MRSIESCKKPFYPQRNRVYAFNPQPRVLCQCVMQSPMQVALKPLKVMMVECNAHSDIIRVYQFNDSFTLPPSIQ